MMRWCQNCGHRALVRDTTGEVVGFPVVGFSSEFLQALGLELDEVVAWVCLDCGMLDVEVVASGAGDGLAAFKR